MNSSRYDGDNQMENFSSAVAVGPVALALSTVLCLASITAGAVCNVLVVITIRRTRTLAASSINRAVVSLCLADLLTVVVEAPLTMSILIGNFVGHVVRTLCCNKYRCQGVIIIISIAQAFSH